MIINDMKEVTEGLIRYVIGDTEVDIGSPIHS